MILEVLSNAPGPATEEKTLEFIEILNLGPDAVDLTGFTVADDLDANAPGIDPLAHLSGEGGCGAIPPCLAPGRRAILVGSDYMGPTGGGLVMTVDDTTLADAGLGSTEPVIVRNREGEIQSTYRVWLDASAEPNPASVEQSLVRIDAQAPDEPASWTFATPTPGE